MAKAITTPKGIAVYPRLTSPDTQYDPDGTYHVKMKFDSDLPAVQALMKKIDAWYDEAFEEAVTKSVEDETFKTEAVARKKVKRGDKPYVYVEDEEGDDTNEIIINFKMKAQAKNRKTGEMFPLNPKLYGAGNVLLKKDEIPLIYSGSELKVGYTPVKWYTKQLGASVKLRLEGAKIITLVSGGSDMDFGDDDDDEGYVPTKQPQRAPRAESSEGDDGGDDGDF